jgi:hypothetical protein
LPRERDEQQRRTSYIRPTDDPSVPVRKRGMEIVRDPALNTGSGFPDSARDALGLRGRVPPQVVSIEDQVERVMPNFHRQHNDLDRYTWLENQHRHLPRRRSGRGQLPGLEGRGFHILRRRLHLGRIGRRRQPGVRTPQPGPDADPRHLDTYRGSGLRDRLREGLGRNRATG